MLAPAALTLVVVLAATPLTIWTLRRMGVLDHPNDRSSHHLPTPRGGGVAVALGVCAGVVLAPDLHGSTRAALLVAAGGLGLIGLVDDVGEVGAVARLVLQSAVAALVTPWLLHGMTGSVAWKAVFAIGVAAWIVSLVNAFNFMDGINGMATGQVIVAGLAWFVIGSARHVDPLAAGGLVLAAAAAGFAPFNAVRARVFLGDVGSYFLGGALAVLAVVGLRGGLPPEAVLAPLAVTLADTGSTLVGRLRRREIWHTPHRHHVYQWFVQQGRSHATTAAAVSGLMVLCAALGAISLGGGVGRVAADIALAGVLLVYVTVPTGRVVSGRLLSWREWVGTPPDTLPSPQPADGSPTRY